MLKNRKYFLKNPSPPSLPPLLNERIKMNIEKILTKLISLYENKIIWKFNVDINRVFNSLKIEFEYIKGLSSEYKIIIRENDIFAEGVTDKQITITKTNIPDTKGVYVYGDIITNEKGALTILDKFMSLDGKIFGKIKGHNYIKTEKEIDNGEEI